LICETRFGDLRRAIRLLACLFVPMGRVLGLLSETIVRVHSAGARIRVRRSMQRRMRSTGKRTGRARGSCFGSCSCFSCNATLYMTTLYTRCI
jgi:hypothetical protein